MNSNRTPRSIRHPARASARPVSRRMLDTATGMLALGLLALGMSLVHGNTLSVSPRLLQRAFFQDSAPAQMTLLPEADSWLATYSACDSPAPALSGSTVRTAALEAARAPVILAKDAVLKLPEAPLEVRRLINEVAAEVKIAPALLHAVIATESRYNPDALSPRGAIGLMQLMPDTALQFGAPDPYNPRDNIIAGANYLKYLLKLFGNDMELALAGYNAGHGAVMRAGNRIPEYPETQAYVPKVMAYLRCAKNKACAPA